jgi:hypothetical protein
MSQVVLDAIVGVQKAKRVIHSLDLSTFILGIFWAYDMEF